METETKVHVVLYSIMTRDFAGSEVTADTKVLGTFRQRVDAQDCVNQFLPDANVWERFEIIERDLV